MYSKEISCLAFGCLLFAGCSLLVASKNSKTHSEALLKNAIYDQYKENCSEVDTSGLILYNVEKPFQRSIKMVKEAQGILSYVFAVEKELLNTFHKIIEKCAEAPNTTVVDIGSNMGVYGILAASYGCLVVMYEPQPVCVDAIRKHICANDLSHLTRLIPHPVMRSGGLKVSPVTGCTGIFPRYTTSASVAADKSATFVNAVQLQDLSGLTKRYAFVKIDTEGGEIEVLSTMMPTFESRRVDQFVAELTPSFWMALNMSRGHVSNTIRKVMHFGYSFQIVECAGSPTPIELIGKDMSMTEVTSFILHRDFLQCDALFKLINMSSM